MRAVFLIAGLSMASPATVVLNAQEFEIVESTWTEFGGALDFIMDVMGSGGSKTQRTMVSAVLSTIRTDDVEDDQAVESNIFEYSTGNVNIVDHKDESYISFNLANVMAGGPFQYSGQPQTTEYEESERDHDGAEYDVSIDITSPGGTKLLLNNMTEQIWVTITATPTKAPKDMSLDSMPTFITLTERWVSDDFPGNTAMAEVSQEAAAYLSKSTGLDPDAMGQAFSQDRQFAEAFGRNEDELEKMHSMALETITVFVSLPPGAEFNPDSALHGSMGEMKIDVVGAVASGVAGAVTGGISRRLGGFGRRREPEPPSAPPAGQTLMFRVHELVESFRSGPLAAGWNVVPSTYEQKESPFQVRPQN